MTFAITLEKRSFRRLTDHLGRIRVLVDTEGWPYAPGRYGRLEWRGKERDGRSCVYAYTDRKKMLAKLRAVATPVQIGDSEGAFRCDTHDQITRVAGLLKLRKKRAPDARNSADRLASMRDRISSKEAIE